MPCVAGLFLANVIAKFARLEKPEIVTLSVECCYQNVGIATSAVLSMFDDPNDVASGQCIIVPIPNNEQSGILLRSVGYAESIAARSEYNFLDDGTFVLKTKYDQSIAEERIWFISENVRCRSSVLKTSEGSGILQTSFSSEVRRLTKS